MRKLTFFIGLAALSAALVLSCSKEKSIDDTIVDNGTPSEEQSTPGDLSGLDPAQYLLSFGARFENEEAGGTPESKVTVDFSSGTPAFEEGDKALVSVPSTGATGVYVYGSDDLFHPEAASDAVAIGDNAAYVYYPSEDVFTVDGERVQFTMPAIEGKLGDLLPMAGKIAKDSDDIPAVTFKNLCSILRVCLTGNRALAKVELTNGNVPVRAGGSFSVSWNGDLPSLDFSGTAETTATISSSAALGAEATDFYFLLPPTETSMTDMKITATMASEDGLGLSSYSLSRSGAMTLSRNQIITVSFYAGLFSGGTGTATDPFLIANARDFKNIQSYTVNGYDNGTVPASTFLRASYQQTADFDIKGATLTPIGTKDAPFTGVYEGGSNSISNIQIGDGGGYGLFGYTSNATIRNLTANTINVTGTGANRGAFIGYMAGGEVNNCHVTGTSLVEGNAAAIGGLVGSIRDAKGIITGCTSTAEVKNNATSGNYATGGIVGLVYTGAAESVVSECSSSGNVSNGCNYSGGIVGRFNIKGTLSKCHTTAGQMISAVQYAGGIAGEMIANVTFSGCTNNANVSADYIAGGIVGVETGGLVTDCINKGKVTAVGSDTSTNSGKFGTGGIAGYQTGGSEILKSWSNATISGKYQTGGIVGFLDYGVIQLCHAKGSVSGTQCVGGIVGHMYSSTADGKYTLALECLANADIDSSTGTNSNSGGVVGRLHSQKFSVSGTITVQYATVAQCVGWSAKIKNTNTSACTRFGAFVGFVNTEQSNVSTNNRCRVFNSYTSVSTDDVIWYAGTPSQTGGFVGQIQRGQLARCFYQLDDNTQSATASSNNVTLSNFAKVNSDFANYLMSNLNTTTNQNVGNDKGLYNGSAWTMTGYNGETLEYPLPSALVALGTEFYD